MFNICWMRHHIPAFNSIYFSPSYVPLILVERRCTGTKNIKSYVKGLNTEHNKEILVNKKVIFTKVCSQKFALQNVQNF